mgnify:FL=1
MEDKKILSVENKEGKVVNMKENIFNDTDFSRFTSLFSLKRTGATHVALCDSVGSYFRHWYRAFTLAEVLITLGIIGVVAALTIPTLMANHRKKVIATRLKHFSSVWQQAYISVNNQNGYENYWGTLVAGDADSALQFYKENFGNYIQTTEIQKSKYGIVASLKNGSGFYFYRWNGQAETSGGTYLTFCPYYKDCIELADRANLVPGEQISDGKTSFSFYMTGKAPEYGVGNNRDRMKNECKSGAKGYCTRLIEFDGWEIRNDYPIRL